ncbi:hypothetical protein KK2020170_21470 [Flavobacterium okayamense]|uniref:Uncharacterized protein n=2 Tax=Flavobacterium okayamense TaxID=2830782 RepID=A0ABM7S6S4_9FLAO|nr:hypothetical protein KK2020170_21470 [Flavobacterium okayamense]
MLFAQDKNEKDIKYYQIQHINSGNIFLKKGNDFNALLSFHSVLGYNFDKNPMTEYEIYARKKIDSLFPIYQKKEKEKWKGKWKLQQLQNFEYNYEYIEFKDSLVLFYKIEDAFKPCRIENLKFANYNDLDTLNFYNSLEFKNNEIWEFTFEVINGEKRLKVYLLRDENKVYRTLLDERGLFRDEQKRKKALEEEILTYYVFDQNQ